MVIIGMFTQKKTLSTSEQGLFIGFKGSLHAYEVYYYCDDEHNSEDPKRYAETNA